MNELFFFWDNYCSNYIVFVLLFALLPFLSNRLVRVPFIKNKTGEFVVRTGKRRVAWAFFLLYGIIFLLDSVNKIGILETVKVIAGIKLPFGGEELAQHRNTITCMWLVPLIAIVLSTLRKLKTWRYTDIRKNDKLLRIYQYNVKYLVLLIIQLVASMAEITVLVCARCGIYNETLNLLWEILAWNISVICFIKEFFLHQSIFIFFEKRVLIYRKYLKVGQIQAEDISFHTDDGDTVTLCLPQNITFTMKCDETEKEFLANFNIHNEEPEDKLESTEKSETKVVENCTPEQPKTSKNGKRK